MLFDDDEFDARRDDLMCGVRVRATEIESWREREPRAEVDLQVGYDAWLITDFNNNL